MKPNEPMSLPCPHCGKKINKTVRWFNSVECVCPFCSGRFNAKQVTEALESAEKSLSRMLKDL